LILRMSSSVLGQAGWNYSPRLVNAEGWCCQAPRAYAVIVDNEEGADVDIIDITDPEEGAPHRRPRADRLPLATSCLCQTIR
jgi:hypothetical protein